MTKRIVDAVGPDAKGVILDVACGPGIVGAALAATARGRGIRSHARDARQSTATLRGVRLHNVTFREGSAPDLPFPDS